MLNIPIFIPFKKKSVEAKARFLAGIFASGASAFILFCVGVSTEALTTPIGIISFFVAIVLMYFLFQNNPRLQKLMLKSYARDCRKQQATHLYGSKEKYNHYRDLANEVESYLSSYFQTNANV